MKALWVGLLMLTMVATACTPQVQLPAVSAQEPLQTATPSPFLPQFGATVTDTPQFLPSITPTLASSPSPVPTLHPMQIDALRAGEYPGSDIVLEQELEPGSNYRRFYAYYLSEGYKIYALLTIPYGDPPPGGWPAIVFNHGYIPPDVYVTTERYINYVGRLAESGYIVFRIDYRGHDRSEGEATGAYGSPGYGVDVLNAVSSIKRFPLANPGKIGMWGHSMGGYLTLRAMVAEQDIKAGVIWAGVVGSYPDMLTNWRRRSTFRPPSGLSSASRSWRDGWVANFGSPEQNPEFWSSVSATSYLADLSGPVQLHHGTLDEDVPFEFSVTLAERIQAAGGVVELYTYEGDNHNLSTYFTTAMNRTIEFYDRYLKGE